MIIEQLYATPQAKAHMLEKHGVAWYEVVEAMSQRGLRPIRARKQNGEMRYQVKSRTEAGRRLLIIFAVERPARARIITARQVGS